MKNTKKLLCSLYVAGVVIGSSILSGCQTKPRTCYIYVNPEGIPVYSDGTPRIAPVRPQRTYRSNSAAGDVLPGILMGIGRGLSGL